MNKYLRYAWRFIRPRVLSVDDYMRLASAKPEELTVAEVRWLLALQQESAKGAEVRFG